MKAATSTAEDANCPLCGSAPRPETVLSRKRVLHECGNCGLIYAAPADRVPRAELRDRYLLHENSIENEGYCQFLSKAIHLARPYLVPGSRGLDFGCGPGPTLSQLVRREGFVMTDYDPIFVNVPLSPPYDFIFSTECFEHFDEPRKDIAKVLSLLRDDGILAVMTDLWDASKDFHKWPYASDPTHVSFYSKKTIGYICGAFGLETLAGDGKRTFLFQKSRGRPSQRICQKNFTFDKS